MNLRWERALLFIGAFVFVLVWIIRNIDYDNLVKWRGSIRKEGNWQWWIIVIFLILVGVATYSVYWFIINVLVK